MREERKERDEEVVRKMLGDRSDTAVDEITVECSIHGTTLFLGSAIMDRHERLNFEIGKTVER